MEEVSERSIERKVFGGTNFIIVLWTLISIFRLVSHMEQDPVELINQPEMFVFIIPLIFLTVLNVIMGIASFFPQKKNKMWILSVLIVSATLLALNSLQYRIEGMQSDQLGEQATLEF